MLSHRVPLALPGVKPPRQSFCPAAYRRCGSCKAVISILEFRWRHFADGRVRVRPRCQKCKRAYEKAYEKNRTFREGIDLRYAKHRAYMATERGQRLARRSEYKRKMDAIRHARRLERMRNTHLLKTYGISEERYAEMLKEQNGVCKICGNPPNKKALVIDHCHTTGRVRSLLCATCNLAIGYFKEDPRIIVQALKYVIEHSVLVHSRRGRLLRILDHLE